jgi:hypothetical protein
MIVMLLSTYYTLLNALPLTSLHSNPIAFCLHISIPLWHFNTALMINRLSGLSYPRLTHVVDIPFLVLHWSPNYASPIFYGKLSSLPFYTTSPITLETCLARLATLPRISFSSIVALLDLPDLLRLARSTLRTLLTTLPTYEPLSFPQIVVLRLLTVLPRF